MKVECIWPGPTSLGEGPLWHPEEKVLYFIDIVQKSLYRLDVKTHEHQVWQMPDFIGSVGARKNGGLIATVGQYVVTVDMPSGKLTRLKKVIPDNRPDLRMNDGKVDQKGRFWIGVASVDAENPKGGLFRYDPDGTLTEMETKITISNGLGWSPNNKTFYYTDGLKYRIYAYDFNLKSGTLCNRRIFLQLPKSNVEPDGLTVDSEGYVWEAAWESGQVTRYAPDGSVDTVVEMPVLRPTSCIIGGDAFDTLYITSCAQSLSETEKLKSPAGGIFALKLKVKGIPEPYFAG